MTEEERPALQAPETVNKPKRFSTELIVALSAIFISMATLFVYIYQARIMQTQQYTSVWPYIEWLTWSSNSDHYFIIRVENKGVGPAIIKDVKMTLNDKEVNNEQLLNELLGKGEYDFDQSQVKGRVIAPREIIEALHIKDSVTATRFLKAYKSDKLKIEICYCSIYDECWTSHGITVAESKCK